MLSRCPGTVVPTYSAIGHPFIPPSPTFKRLIAGAMLGMTRVGRRRAIRMPASEVGDATLGEAEGCSISYMESGSRHRAGLVHGNLHPGNVKVAQQPPNLLIKLLECGVPPPEPHQAAWGRRRRAARAGVQSLSGERGLWYRVWRKGCGIARQNACTANARAGITVAGETQPVLEANSCYQNAEYGIQYAASASGVARQNSCTANGKDGLVLAGQAQPVLEANSCQGNAWCGIGYGGKAGGSARQNTCAGNEKDGIGIADEAQPLLLSNLCRENAWCGIAFYSAAMGVARLNECAANGGDGIAVSGQAQSLIELNTCRENA